MKKKCGAAERNFFLISTNIRLQMMLHFSRRDRLSCWMNCMYSWRSLSDYLSDGRAMLRC